MKILLDDGFSFGLGAFETIAVRRTERLSSWSSICSACAQRPYFCRLIFQPLASRSRLSTTT